MFFDILTVIIAVLMFISSIVCMNIGMARRRISVVRKNQKYAFHIQVVISDYRTYEFEVYSDFPYNSITEIMQHENMVKNERMNDKKEFIEFCYQKEQVVLNRNKIISATMRRNLTGIEKEKTTKSLADRIGTIKKRIKERQLNR